MKKVLFFVLLCSVFGHGAYAISIQEPTVSSAASSWELKSGNVLSISTDLYGDGLTGFTNEKEKAFFAGTYSDERAMVALIAREIYANGAKFCITQIQSANKEAHKWQWLDYYAPTNSNCFVMCKSGFGGDKCEKGSIDSCDTANYKTKLNGYKDNKITTGKDNGKITSSVQVLSYKNQRNQTNKNMPGAEHIVLGVIEVFEHGVMVAPIKIQGKRTETTSSGGMGSWIDGIGVVGAKVNLCALGYKYIDGKCTAEDICATQSNLNNLCTGNNRDDYVAGTHTLKQKGSCYVIRCSTGYGFESASSKSCKECGGARQGPDTNGVCQVCDRGTVYNSSSESCVTARALSKEQMLHGTGGTKANCWQKLDLQEYKECLKI